MNVTYGHVGDRINAPSEMDELPSGSVIREVANPTTNQYTKREDGQWVRNLNGHSFRSNAFSMGGTMEVESIPDGWVSRPRPQETVEQHMWTFRDRALFSAYNHSVNYEASEAAIQEMGAKREDFTLGRGVRITDPVERDRLPDGTVVYMGEPDNPQRFGMFHKVDGRWQHLLGDNWASPGDVVLHTYAGSTEQPDWLTREGTEDDAEAIANFRAKAWRVGWRLKNSQGWCSTYEAVMRDMGLTAAVVRAATHKGIRVGDTVRPDMAHDLPDGSIFQWTSSNDPNEVALFVRTMSSDNRAGTIRFGGTQSDSNRNYRSSMRVLYLPTTDEPFSWQPEDVLHTFELFNPGVCFGIDTQRPDYVKALDGKVAQAGGTTPTFVPGQGRWNVSDFGNSPNLYVTSIVGVIA